jgi:bacillolysin
MKKATQMLVAVLLAATCAQAQNTEKRRPAQRPAPAPERLHLRPEALKQLPVRQQTAFEVTPPDMSPKTALQRVAAPAAKGIEIDRDADGTPIFYRGTTEASVMLAEGTAPSAYALEYLMSLPLEGIADPANEFAATSATTDGQGNHHVRFEQRWNGVPVYGSELVAHTQQGQFALLNGRFRPSAQFATMPMPSIAAADAIEAVKNDIGQEKIKQNWSEMDLRIIGKAQPFEAKLVVYKHLNAFRYAYQIEAHPNLMRRATYFVDAQTGAVLHQFDQTCRLHDHAHCDHGDETVVNGPVTANGNDLLGVNRSFGAWQDGNKVYMEDASQPMFNTASQMPEDPAGAIVTLDAKNTSPEVQQSFDFDFVTSNNTTYNNTTAVSAHWNSIKSYRYFLDKFGRNSIDGNGGNIISFINVSESDGSSMENAFWNGAAMWYGNGGSTFKKLARGLDVGGHEMSHGVVEKTANLEYQGESGALNESFADIFGAMIDPGDWQIGEDVMQPNTHTCLRDLSNPNNGLSQSSPFWQPAHVNQQYFGNQDNGGVHINSGIVNKAYYNFATNAAVGTDKAEQVYYKALRDYLIKSSKFVDCRLAVIQAAQDLYGTSVANAAASAFEQVGIGGSAPSGNYLGQLSLNPGTPLIMCVAQDDSSFDLADQSGTVLGVVYDEEGILSRPSISDNGSTAIFVNDVGHLILVDFSYSNGQINRTTTQLSQFAEWRNAAISKDGRFIAAVTDAEDNNMYVFDLLSTSGNGETYPLFNPTYTQGVTTGDVLFADVMEFDYSGRYIMYDAYNQIDNATGQSFTYWDIGFIEFWENNSFANPDEVGISKLFNGLPESVDIGNPTFAKNAPYIVAFDYKDNDNGEHDVLGVNIETGDYDVAAGNIGTWGWPNYDMKDESILHNRLTTAGGYNIRKQGVTASKIKQQGTAQTWVTEHYKGVWYGTGNRSLMVSTNGPTTYANVELSAMPNPTHDNVRIAFNAPRTAKTSVVVSDMMGRHLHQYSVTAQEGSNYLDLSLRGLAAGTYLVQLRSEGMFGVVRVVLGE